MVAYRALALAPFLCLVTAQDFSTFPVSLQDVISNALPSDPAFSTAPLSWISAHTLAAETFAEKYTSIIVNNPSYFPTAYASIESAEGVSHNNGGIETGMASGSGSGSLIFGASTTMTMAQSTTQAMASSTVMSMSTAESSSTVRTTGTSGNAGTTVVPVFGPTVTAASSSSSTGNFGFAQATPAIGLGLAGAAVAGVAGLAVFL